METNSPRGTEFRWGGHICERASGELARLAAQFRRDRNEQATLKKQRVETDGEDGRLSQPSCVTQTPWYLTGGCVFNQRPRKAPQRLVFVRVGARRQVLYSGPSQNFACTWLSIYSKVAANADDMSWSCLAKLPGSFGEPTHANQVELPEVEFSVAE
jgi:hypothetical protein